MKLTAIIATLRDQQKELTAQVAALNDAITALSQLGGHAARGRKTRNISAAGRARIAAAQRKRWAKIRAAKKTK